MRTCSIPDCGRKHKGLGFCQLHRRRFHSTGDPLKVKTHIVNSDDPENRKERFDRKWKKASNGCWLWQANSRKPVKGNDYERGIFRINKRNIHAHRAAWIIYKGEIPNGLHVLHKCNNALCVNPDHLYLGTHQQNMRDMVDSYRCGGTKLSRESVIKIRERQIHGSITQIAKLFGVSATCIKRIRARKTHRYV